MKNLQKICLFLFLILSSSIAKAEVHYVKTGYFTHVYAREHVTDMPRAYYMLIEADGTITPIWFHRYSTKNKGEFSKWTFDPREYLGKVISIDVTGVLVQNNNEYPIYDGDKLVLLENFELEEVNSWNISRDEITVKDEYKYPNTDTLLIPHDVLVPYEEYEDKNPTKVIQLTDYVTGDGTEASPYISADGYAGLKAACAALPDGGTIEMSSGIYKATSKNLSIPRFVSIKGTGATKPLIYLTDERMWSLKGSNTIDNIDVDMTLINRSYTHEVIAIQNNARDVTIKHTKLIGNYKVDPVTYKESGSIVMVRMYSHLNNITFDSDTIISPLRGISTKGQRNQHNITFKNCLFTDQGQMCVTLDQSSNTSNILFENNKFIEFTHFGVALARVNDVTFRGNTFYSRNTMSFNTYNQAFHIEEHTQNLLIEDNHVDVILRHSENDNPNTQMRSDGCLAMDSRNMIVRNNTFKNCDLIMGGNLSEKSGYTILENNNIDNGGIDIRELNDNVTVKHNVINNPPVQGIYFYSVVPRHYPFQGHKVIDNKITNLDNASALGFSGEIIDVSITNNDFQGCAQKASSLDFKDNSKDINIEDNTFRGVLSNNAFVFGNEMPSSISVSRLKRENTFLSDCKPSSVSNENVNNGITLYPNPANDILSIKGLESDYTFEIFNLQGAIVQTGITKNSNLNIGQLNAGLYVVRFDGKSFRFSKR